MLDFIAFIGLFVGGVFFTKQAGGALPPIIETPKATPQTVNQIDLDTMARTMWGEARNEGYAGMQGVANVIMNRYALAQQSNARARQFGATPAAICKKPWQFSVWNANDPNLEKILNVTTANRDFRTALEIAEKALLGQLSDVTGGADHYHAHYVAPNWSEGVRPTTIIKNHQFYKLA